LGKVKPLCSKVLKENSINIKKKIYEPSMNKFTKQNIRISSPEIKFTGNIITVDQQKI
jgi:hypothetical protein